MDYFNITPMDLSIAVMMGTLGYIYLLISMLAKTLGVDPIILSIMLVAIMIVASVSFTRFLIARSRRRKLDIANLFKKIRNRKDKADDLHQVCVINFLGQLEWDEYPQSKMKYIMDLVDEQRKYLLEEFDDTLLSVLNERIQNGDMGAMVLLGQYYYDRPQDDLDEDVLVAKLVDEVCGGVSAENKTSNNQIKNGHQIASHLFKQAFEKDSIFAMYYLVKLWEEGIISSPNPNELSEIMENKRISGEIYTTDCTNKEKIAVQFIQHAINLAYLKCKNIALGNENIELVNTKIALAKEKKQTESLMGFIAHSTRGDIISLEASLKKNHDIHASQSIVENLKKEMELFSFLSSSPEKITEQMRDDSAGKVSLGMLIDHAVFSSVLLVLSPESRDKGLINHRYLRSAKQTKIINSKVKQKDWVGTASFNDFQEKLFMEFLQVKHDVISAHAWIASYFGEIQVNIDESVYINMTRHGMRATVLSAILSELIINAFKYGVADQSKPTMKINCTADLEKYQFSCSNIPAKMEQMRSQKGSRKGQEAMSLLLAKLHLPHLLIESENGDYSATFYINKDLMGG